MPRHIPIQASFVAPALLSVQLCDSAMFFCCNIREYIVFTDIVSYTMFCIFHAAPPITFSLSGGIGGISKEQGEGSISEPSFMAFAEK